MNKKGVSLIVLIVTIMIMIMLSAVVILSMRRDNSIDHAKEARFRQDVEEMDSALKQTIGALIIQDSDINSEKINETFANGIKKYIPNFEDKYVGVFEIYKGEISYVGSDNNEKEWARELGILKEQIDKTVQTGYTETKSSSKYDLPYIPKGFYYVGGTSKDGLVISDNSSDLKKGIDATLVGNQYVWIPVDKSNVTFGMDYTDSPFDYRDKDDIDKVKESVALYGGFYMGRYEASLESNKVITKKGKNPQININYTQANKNATNLYPSSDVVSTLPYGAMWDTVCKWFIYSRIVPNYSITGQGGPYGTFAKSSLSLTGTTTQNNISDMAGNAEEWSKEIYVKQNNSRVLRGSDYSLSISSDKANFGNRNYKSESSYSSKIGYRVALYIDIQ